MKKFLLVPIAFGLAVSAQGGLLSGGKLLDVAKVILNNRAVLNKGQQQCPNQIIIQPQENLLMTAARDAVRNALVPAQFSGLESAAETVANRSAASPDFCQTTQTRKPGLLGGIADAARKMGVGGGILGGGASTPAKTGGLGGLLGGSGN